MDFGQRVKERREELGWKQKDLAMKAGISPGFLSELENGKRNNVGSLGLLNLSRVLTVSLDYLMTGAGSKKRTKAAAADVEIPGSLAAFAAAAGISFRQTLLLLELQQVIVAHRKAAGKKPSLEKVDWPKFYEAVKGFL